MYVQQIGRAGRGDKGARVTLMINKSDTASNVKGLTDEMRGYCLTKKCRRQYLCQFFGYNLITNASNCCDNCNGNYTLVKASAELTSSFVPEVLVVAIEQNLRKYASIDVSLSEQLTHEVIKSIARRCKNIESAEKLSTQYGLEVKFARSVYNIVTALNKYH